MPINRTIKPTISALLIISGAYLLGCGESAVEKATRKNGEPSEIIVTGEAGQSAVPAGRALQMFVKGGTKPLVWSINTDNSEISANGTLSAGASSAGTSVLVTATDQLGMTGSKTVDIEAAILQNIVISTVVTSVASGASVIFAAIGTYSDGSTSPITSLVKWSSSANSSQISFVSPAGTVKTVVGYAGEAVIRAKLDGISAELILTVNAPTIIVAGEGDATSVNVGQMLLMSASGGTGPYTWSVDDSLLASIDAVTGEVTGKRSGRVEIIVKDAYLFSSSAVIIVLPAPPFLTSSTVFNIEENNNFVAEIVASDSIGTEQFNYTIVGGVDSAQFSIDDNGQLRFNVANTPNFELPVDIPDRNNSYELTVQVENIGGATLQKLIIDISNIADEFQLNFGNLGRGYYVSPITGTGNEKANSIIMVGWEDMMIAGEGFGFSSVVWKMGRFGVLDNSVWTGFGPYVVNEFGITVKQGWVGLVNSECKSNGGYLNDLAITNTDTIIIVGICERTTAAFEGDMIVWSIRSDGQLNTDFATGFGAIDPGNSAQRLGYMIHGNAAGGNFIDSAEAVAIAADGKIIVAGWSTGQSLRADMVVWRLNANGSLDTDLTSGFGITDPNNASQRLGYMIHDNAAGGRKSDRGFDVALTPENKIIVAGTSWGGLGKNNDMVVWRITQDGSLDTDLATGFGYPVRNDDTKRYGYFTFNSGLSDGAVSVDMASDGNIIVAGNSYNGNSNDVMVWKLLSDGSSLDFGFGDVSTRYPTKKVGYMSYDSSFGGKDIAENVSVASDGKIIVSGSINFAPVGGNSDTAIWRLTRDGNLDITFGNGAGVITHDSTSIGRPFDIANDFAIDYFGRIRVAGYSGTILPSDYRMMGWAIW